MISFDLSTASGFIKRAAIRKIEPEVLAARDTLVKKTGIGSEYTGWIDLPINYDKEEFARIKKAAAKIRKESDALLVIGVGGSYLGARAAIESLTETFHGISSHDDENPQIIFCGNSISAKYMRDVMEYVKDKDFSIIMISKSGTTTEPAIAFRIFEKMLVDKYGKEEAAKRIYATTDKAKGALKTMADAEGYETFVVPDDIGGRYSVLTAVGLLPIAAAGINIDKMLAGARDAREVCLMRAVEGNPALSYAAYRNILYRSGKSLEILVNYEPQFHSFAEWWKQLFGESEGKDGKGIFPASAQYTTDLHSFGQFIQDGTRMMFETMLSIVDSGAHVEICESETNLDGLNYLAGKDVDYVNKCAMEGTILAHKEGGTPTLVFNIPKCDEYNLGALFYILEFACGVSGYMLGVNPFDQPGVEAYKRNMFAILGKPGYEGVLEGK